MEALNLLWQGLDVALTPENLMYAVIGSIVGTLVGVLPGIGPTAGMAMLIPLTFSLPPVGAIIMLCAIFYGSQYGGTITTILLNMPGEASSTVTVVDGHELAVRGRAGAALSIAAIGSFIGGTVATIGLALVAKPVTSFALRFGPPEYVAMVGLGLCLILVLAGRSLSKALIMAGLGMLLATIGLDQISGSQRFTFGRTELYDGVDVVAMLMGLFGVSEILTQLEAPVKHRFLAQVGSLRPTRQELRDSGGPIARGTVVGFALGFFPGITAAVSAFASYAVEKRVSKRPESFGRGAIEGVAGPETSNNAHANAALIPLFTLGIPCSPSLAVLMTALVINGLSPGPRLFTDHRDAVWAIIASMVVGNVILLVLNLPLIRVWVLLLKVPYPILATLIIVFSVIGAYSIDGRMFEVWLVLGFGVAGYLFRKLDLPLIPLVLAFILGPVFEDSLRQSLVLFGGTYTGFAHRPIAMTLFVACALVLASGLRRAAKQAKSRSSDPVASERLHT